MTQDAERPGRIIVEIDPDLEELIPGYLKNRQKDIQGINEALARADFEWITRLGHTLKGSGSGYGFDFISAIGLSLENSGKEKSVEKIQTSVNDLCDFLERVEVVYR